MSDIIDVSWGEEPISVEKLQVMAENQRKLRNMIPTVLLNTAGVKKSTGVKILAGTTIAPPSMTRSQNQDVYFGNFFSVGCNPVVVAQNASVTWRAVHLGTHGLGKTDTPSHVGFTCHLMYDGISGAKGALTTPITIHWIAVGW